MELQRDQEVVESFNYGLPPKDQVVKQKLLINFSPLEAMDPGYPAEIVSWVYGLSSCFLSKNLLLAAFYLRLSM